MGTCYLKGIGGVVARRVYSNIYIKGKNMSVCVGMSSLGNIEDKAILLRLWFYEGALKKTLYYILSSLLCI